MQIKFGEVLKTIRKSRNIGISKLAADLDIPESNLRRYESSNDIPQLQRIKEIADYFGVSIDTILGFSDLSVTDQVESDVLQKYLQLNDSDKELVDNIIKRLVEKQ